MSEKKSEKKTEQIVKPQGDTHITGEPDTTPKPLDTHITSGDITTQDTHITSEPA
ncbi:hypothetical protein ACIBJC_13185 [Streptomyces sp. NPDC050509]|uniref:hypothetical protein n=1 Tax=Streptomyces sp. NPDC050509 TaxID=3365620 RepID=UPI0037AAB8F5